MLGVCILCRRSVVVLDRDVLVYTSIMLGHIEHNDIVRLNDFMSSRNAGGATPSWRVRN